MEGQTTVRILRKLEDWEPLQRFECWRDQSLGKRVDERPDAFRWVDGIPQRRKDLILAWLTGNTPWEGWRNWVSRWTAEPSEPDTYGEDPLGGSWA